PTPIPLILWTNNIVAPRTELPGGDTLTTQLNAFNNSHPDVSLHVSTKNSTGPGGILQYLRTGRTIAPDILPDLILLPTEQIPSVYQEGLIYAIGDQLPVDMLNDLYPAALTLGQVNDELIAYPYLLNNLQHVAYNDTLTTTLTTDWSDLLDTNAKLTIAADGSAGARLALAFYIAFGGQLTNDAGQNNWDPDILTTALNELENARRAGLIIPASSTNVTLDDNWLLFEENSASVVQTNANLFLNKREAGFNSRFAPIPGPNGPLPAHVTGWAWAITTTDPVRQALAIELLTWLSSPANLGQWTTQTNYLPARRSAWEEWPNPNDDYILFLQAELERARPFPPTATTALMGRLETAVAEVISLAKPAAAAAEAAAAPP
ncbi:MAG TPA: extracellular solute-binding protein, partial [Anaerolineae bacterium]|nr:extracellular solute-binding protein [Anaerolineae bacterium]